MFCERSKLGEFGIVCSFCFYCNDCYTYEKHRALETFMLLNSIAALETSATKPSANLLLRKPPAQIAFKLNLLSLRRYFLTKNRMPALAQRNTIIPNTPSTPRRIQINVGGEKYSPYVSTLGNLPDSPLSWIIREEYKPELDFDPATGEYFFDRHPGVFLQILNYFQTGKLHCPRDVCGPMFQKELNFWGIDETQMEACCWTNFTKHREIQENLKLLNIKRRETRQVIPCHGCYTTVTSRISKWKRYQMVIWELLDEPYSSTSAMAYAYFSLGFIVLSIVTFSAMTVNGVKNRCLSINSSINTTSSPQNCKYVTTEPMKIIRQFELVFAIWFTIEIVLRFIFSPNKREYGRKISNWMDLIAIIPLYVFLLIDPASESVIILNMVRYVRIIRFFKLLYDLQILGKTIQASLNQLLMLLLILCIPAIIFASIVFYTEKSWGTDGPLYHKFKDIPNVFWWSIITMTTIGYGDMSPYSYQGKIVGAMSTIVGILVLSLTASILGTSFQQYYMVARTQLQIPPKISSTVKIDTCNSLSNQINMSLKHHASNKSASIKSDDSKDSGYGRSPVPPAEQSSPDCSYQERNFIVKIGGGETKSGAKESALL